MNEEVDHPPKGNGEVIENDEMLACHVAEEASNGNGK